MALLPYGYKYQKGKIVIDEQAAERVNELFNSYLSGLSYQLAVKAAGISVTHSQAKSMLANSVYTGNEVFPAIIETELFNKVAIKKIERENKNKSHEGHKVQKPISVATKFTINEIKQESESLYENAQLIYESIRIEETT